MLNDREAFKAGFLKRCADEGLSPEETLSLVKQANEQVTKQAYGPLLDAISSAGKSIGGKALGWGIPLALGIPPAAGVAGAYAYSKATDSDETDVDSVRKKELAELYREQAKMIRESRRRYASS